MRRSTLFGAGILALSTLLVVPFVSAGEDRGWYAGAGIGSSDDDVLDESDTGFKMFGGYRFNRMVAVEAAAVDLGEFLLGSLEQGGVAIEGEFTLSLGDRFGLFAKGGFFSWEVDVGPFNDDGTDTTYGIGAKATIGRHWAVRVEWERFNDISGGDVDLLSGSAYYRF